MLDPFNGSGTTQLVCKLKGIPSYGIDANNFMVFAAQQKLNWNVNCDAIEAAKQHIIATYLAAAAGIDWDDRDHLAALANTGKNQAVESRRKGADRRWRARLIFVRYFVYSCPRI